MRLIMTTVRYVKWYVYSIFFIFHVLNTYVPCCNAIYSGPKLDLEKKQNFSKTKIKRDRRSEIGRRMSEYIKHYYHYLFKRH